MKSQSEQKATEAAELSKRILNYDHILLLDVKGKEYDTQGFSTLLGAKMNQGIKNLCFVIGGPYGFDPSLTKEHPGISLSRLTFSHQLVRLVFMEQLYRAVNLLRGGSYHH